MRPSLVTFAFFRNRICLERNYMADRILHLGMIGEDVRRVQAALIIRLQKCPLLKMDAIYGNITKGQVILFQRESHLVPDGIVGDKTRGALLLPPGAGPDLINQLALEAFVLNCLKRENGIPNPVDPNDRNMSYVQAELRQEAAMIANQIMMFVFS
jgi:peptidoglycan hydrolase-like protein with peptidoglycan-binding domain